MIDGSLTKADIYLIYRIDDIISPSNTVVIRVDDIISPSDTVVIRYIDFRCLNSGRSIDSECGLYSGGV